MKKIKLIFIAILIFFNKSFSNIKTKELAAMAILTSGIAYTAYKLKLYSKISEKYKNLKEKNKNYIKIGFTAILLLYMSKTIAKKRLLDKIKDDQQLEIAKLDSTAKENKRYKKYTFGQRLNEELSRNNLDFFKNPEAVKDYLDYIQPL